MRRLDLTKRVRLLAMVVAATEWFLLSISPMNCCFFGNAATGCIASGVLGTSGMRRVFCRHAQQIACYRNSRIVR